jgi:lamin tail-like protein/Big-like domain-containing protein
VLDLAANDLPGPPNESGQVLRVSAVGAPAHGSVVLVTSGLDAGKVRYTPAPDYNGPDAFGYQVCDDGTTNGVPDPKCAGSTVAFSFSASRSPLSIALPKVTGRTTVGRPVQADPGRWSPGVRDTEFQWLRCNLRGGRCAPIPKATDASYVLRVADIGRRLRVRVTVANRFGRSSALSTSTPPIPSPIVFSRIVFHPRARSQHESVALRNVGADRVQLRGWTIGDGDGNRFRFGSLSLTRGRSVTVETGAGVATATRRFWRREQQVWDDRGERALLRAPNGALADSCRYRAAGSGVARC